jgi:hypothetical protein
VWFSVKAFPSDTLRESAEGQPDSEAYRGLLEQVVCAVPSPAAVPAQTLGG